MRCCLSKMTTLYHGLIAPLKESFNSCAYLFEQENPLASPKGFYVFNYSYTRSDVALTMIQQPTITA